MCETSGSSVASTLTTFLTLPEFLGEIPVSTGAWLTVYMLNHSVLHEGGGDTPTEFLTKALHLSGGEGLCTAEKAWVGVTLSFSPRRCHLHIKAVQSVVANPVRAKSRASGGAAIRSAFLIVRTPVNWYRRVFKQLLGGFVRAHSGRVTQ